MGVVIHNVRSLHVLLVLDDMRHVVWFVMRVNVVVRDVALVHIVVHFLLLRMQLEGWMMAVLVSFKLRHPSGSLGIMRGMVRFIKRVSLHT